MAFNYPRLRQALTPIALAIVSIIAAVALWVAVTNEENPTTDREFPVTIPIQPVGVPDGLAVLSMTPDSVTVTVRATDESFEQLTAANFRATVNLTGNREPQSTQNIGVEIVEADEDEVGIVSTAPTFTRVVLEAEATKTVPVQVNRLGTLAQGFTITSTQTNPEEVTVVGPTSSVELVEHADVDVNLTGVRSNIELDYALTPRDGGGAAQPRVRVEPTSAEVRMSVQQLQTPQVLPVLPRVQGEVAAGYNIVNIVPDRRIVQVTGSLEVLQSLDALETEPIDVSGSSTTVTRTVALRTPTGVQAERESITVTVEIEPAPGARALTVAPVIENVPAGMSAVLQTTSLTVRISGETPVLNDITPADIRATVNATGLTAGVHTLNVTVTVPGTVVLDGVDPPQAVIALMP